MKIWKQPKSKWLLGIPIGAVIAVFVGVIGWNIFMGTMHATSTTEFCSTCHEEIDTVVEEYKESIHFKNKSGVRAECQDCHLQEKFIPYMLRKIEASKEVYIYLFGDRSKANFEDHRERMAEKVWGEMKETDSVTCRSCHKIDSMDLETQSRSVKRKHNTMMEKGKTCIDCHTGVAHKLPEISF